MISFFLTKIKFLTNSCLLSFSTFCSIAYLYFCSLGFYQFSKNPDLLNKQVNLVFCSIRSQGYSTTTINKILVSITLRPFTNSLNTNLPFHNEMTLRLQQELVVHNYCGDAATGLQ